MESMKELDRCVAQISSVQRSSVKLLDAFVRTSNTIERCTTRVNNECVALHACQFNIEATLRELSAASRCFEMPPDVASVLRRQDRTPLGLAKAIEYFSSALDYLLEHLPGNSEMIDQTERRLATVDSLVEKEVLGCLRRAMGMQVVDGDATALGASATLTSATIMLSSATFQAATDDDYGHDEGGLQTSLFPKRAELSSLGELVRMAFSAFDKTELFEEAIPAAVLQRIKQLLDPLFDSQYMEVFEPATFYGFAASAVVLGEAAQAARNTKRLTKEPMVFAAIAEKVRTGSHLATTIDDAFEVTEESFEVAELTQALDKQGWRAPKHLISTASPLSRRNYRKGEHLLIRISAWCRGIVLEASGVLNDVLLVPLRDDFMVAEAPASIASAVFSCILRHAFQSIYVPQLLLDATSTEMFLLSGGTGYGLVTMNGSRTLRDCLFIGLDLLAELWTWREVASELHGETYRFAEVVEEGILAFAKQVAELLEGWRSKFGSIDQGELVKGDKMRGSHGEGAVAPGWDTSNLGSLHNLASRVIGEGMRFEMSSQTGRRCWAPAYDCAPHEATVNFLFVTRTLFEDYFGALKLILNGGDVGAADDAAVMDELEEFLHDNTENHLTDLRSLVRAQMALTHIFGTDQDPLTPSAGHTNDALFVLNNVTYIRDGLKGEPFASKTKIVKERVQTTTTDESDGPATGHSVFVEAGVGGGGPVIVGGRAPLGARRLVKRSIAQTTVDSVVQDIPGLLEEYEERWAEVFPSLEEGSAPDEVIQLAHSTKASLPLLNKAQRMALKYHHELIAKQLNAAIAASRLHTVHDASIRVQLVERAMASVRNEFARLEAEMVKGRAWSKEPQKWLQKTPQEWVAEIAKIL